MVSTDVVKQTKLNRTSAFYKIKFICAKNMLKTLIE